LEIARLHAVERADLRRDGDADHPSGAPRVFAAATSPGADRTRTSRSNSDRRRDQRSQRFVPAPFAQIPGIRLLGEFRFRRRRPQSRLPRPPRGSPRSGIPVDLVDLDRDSERIEQSLLQLLQQMQAAGQAQQAQPQAEETPAFGEQASEPTESEVPAEVTQRIEALFEQARQDRSKALELKLELDRRGLFRRYEDRFLDLFKK
jgi:hypothetical protein